MAIGTTLVMSASLQDISLYIHNNIPYGWKLWCHENLAKLTTDQKNSPNFHHLNFYTSIVKSHVNIKQIEDVFLGKCATTCRIPSITLSIAMAYESCKFPVSCSQGKSPSAKGLSHMDW